MRLSEREESAQKEEPEKYMITHRSSFNLPQMRNEDICEQEDLEEELPWIFSSYGLPNLIRNCKNCCKSVNECLLCADEGGDVKHVYQINNTILP